VNRSGSPARSKEARLLSSINRSSKNFEVRRALTAHQLFTILKEVSYTVLLLEHDSTLFEDAEEMLPQIAGMLRDISRESLVILYTPSIDRPFSILMRQAPYIIELPRQMILSGLPSIEAHDCIIIKKAILIHSGPWR
jgi:hypothetical protein